MHLMIFSPGKVDHGFIDDDATNEAIYDMMFTAATKEQGNGKERKEDTRTNMGRKDSLGI